MLGLTEIGRLRHWLDWLVYPRRPKYVYRRSTFGGQYSKRSTFCGEMAFLERIYLYTTQLAEAKWNPFCRRDLGFLCNGFTVGENRGRSAGNETILRSQWTTLSRICLESDHRCLPIDVKLEVPKRSVCLAFRLTPRRSQEITLGFSVLSHGLGWHLAYCVFGSSRSVSLVSWLLPHGVVYT